ESLEGRMRIHSPFKMKERVLTSEVEVNGSELASGDIALASLAGTLNFSKDLDPEDESPYAGLEYTGQSTVTMFQAAGVELDSVAIEFSGHDNRANLDRLVVTRGGNRAVARGSVV